MKKEWIQAILIYSHVEPIIEQQEIDIFSIPLSFPYGDLNERPIVYLEE